MPEKEAGGDTMNLLQKLDREEILEVLSEEGVFCKNCESLLQSRILNLLTRKMSEVSLSHDNTESSEEFWSASANASSLSLSENDLESSTIVSNRQESASWSSSRTPESVYSARRKDYAANLSPASSVTSKQHSLNQSGSETLPNGGPRGVSSVVGNGISQDEKERVMFSQVGRKKDFVHIERVNEKPTNVLQGLELHTRVFSPEEQKNIVECVYNLQRMGQKGQLRARTYSEPSKWMRGKGRVTMQFGCCYNYAVDKKGNPPGIIRDEEVDPLPPLFKQMIKKMVRWHVLPSTCVPNSCIVNIYDEGDCIPPHVDHHDFLRPFCTVSFLTECKILFGSTLKIVGPGEFSGPVSIPLPVGSVLILSGNGANVAKHSVPAVPTKRISITFRKMDDSKLPYKFSPDPELLGIKPLAYSSTTKSPVQRTQHQQSQQQQHQNKDHNNGVVNEVSDNSFVVAKDDFPPLGSSTSGKNQQRVNNRIGFRR